MRLNTSDNEFLLGIRLFNIFHQNGDENCSNLSFQIIYSSGKGLKRVLYFQCTGSADLSIVDSSNTELQMFKGYAIVF